MPKSSAGKRPTGGKKTGAANRGNRKGQGTLKAGSAFNHSNASSKAGRTTPNGETRVKGSNFRSEGTIKRLHMYNSKPDVKRMKEQKLKPVRIQPDRRWFGNTRTIAQDKMQTFRETLTKGVEDPFSVVLKSSKLPMSLLKEAEDKSSRMKLLEVEPFDEVFGKGRRQKRAKLGSYDLEGLIQSVEHKSEGYAEGAKDEKARIDFAGHEKPGLNEGTSSHAPEEIFNKGTSRRIWGELYKVVDASDVLVFVLDARDPMGTRCQMLEREIRKNRPNKHIVLLVNKVDLVPTWVSRRWIFELMKEFPTLAFHASITNPFGKNSLLNLLRQFSTLLKEKKHVTVGMIGYPNVGKSSVINTMKRKKVCKAAPVPGETKVWQYIAMSSKIYLIDCPGIVPPTASDFSADCAKVLKGVVRAERIQTPSDYIDEVLSRVKKQYLLQRYKLPPETQWTDGQDFLSVLAHKMGKLRKGGEPDVDTTARIVLYDWQRGRIPYFTPPPEDDVGQDDGITQSNSASDEAGTRTEAVRDADLPDSQGTAANINGSQEVDADPAGTASTSARPDTPSVRQSLSELVCSMDYDEEDRRGEAMDSSIAPLPHHDKGNVSDDGDAGGEGDVANMPAKKRKRHAGLSSGNDKADRPKKKNRRGKGSSKAGNGEGGVPSNPIKRDSMDWKAVVAEFGM